MELHKKYKLEESKRLREEQHKEREWIRKNVVLKCNPTEDPPRESTKCPTCRQSRQDVHDFECNAFGEIEFSKNDTNTAKYVRVREASKMDDLLFGVWKEDPPQLLISVIGGSVTGRKETSVMGGSDRDEEKTTLQMTGAEKEFFCDNLKKLVDLTGAWIITSGMNNRVLKYIGETFIESRHNRQVPIVGVVPWASLTNKDKLVDNEGKWPYVEESYENEKDVLNGNCTHFFLVDEDGNRQETSGGSTTQGTIKHHTTFRNELETNLINHIKDHKEKYDVGHKPAVILVIGGQLDDLKLLNNAVNQDNPTTVVIIEGFGGVADILASVVGDCQRGSTADEQSVAERVGEQCKKEEKVSLILDISTHWRNINVVKSKEVINDEFGLAKAIYSCIAEGDDGPLKKGLFLNTIDSEELVDLKKENVDRDMVLTALRHQRADFVQLFIDKELELDMFLTQGDLRTLYEDKYNTLEPLMNYSFFKKLKSLGYTLPIDLNSIQGGTTDRNTGRKSDADKEKDEHISLEHVFVWCLMVENLNLSKILWKKLHEPTAAALFAIGLYRIVIKTKKLKPTETLKIKNDNIGDFEKLAMEMLNMAYARKMSFDILVQELDYWNKKSCLSLASNTKNIVFMSHTACQEVMDYFWWGKFKLSSVPSVIWYSTFGIIAVCDKQVRQNVNGFYTSPVVIIILHLLSYLIFLALYSYLMLVKFNPHFTDVEGVVCFWVFTIACEEIRQIYSGTEKTYRSDMWNKLDTFTIVLFMIGIILRVIPDDDTFEAARVFLCVNLVLFYLRILSIAIVWKHLGPKIQMMRKMVREDLMPFMLIILVFIFAYSISSEAILYPNTELSWKLLYHIPRKAYWQLYGEFFLEDMEGPPDCTDDPALYNNYTMLRCPSEVGKYTAPVFLGMFMLAMVILLLNLLIAMFSHTFQQVQKETYEYWCYQRYKLIHEYYFRPALPPPLIFLVHVFKFFRLCVRKCRCSENVILPESPFSVKKKRKITKREQDIADECLKELVKNPQSMGGDDFRKDDCSDVLSKLSVIHDLVEEIGVRKSKKSKSKKSSEDPRDLDREPTMSRGKKFRDILTRLSAIHGLVDDVKKKVSNDAVSCTGKAPLEEQTDTENPTRSSPHPKKESDDPVPNTDKTPTNTEESTKSDPYRKLDDTHDVDSGITMLKIIPDEVERITERKSKETTHEIRNVKIMLKENQDKMETIIERLETKVPRGRNGWRGYHENGSRCHCYCRTCLAVSVYAPSRLRNLQQRNKKAPKPEN